MNDLLSAIEYLRCGRDEFRTFAFFDDEKGMPEEMLKKIPKTRREILHIKNLEYELSVLYKIFDEEKRAFCFFPNGAQRVPDIDGLRFLFVDIDDGSKKEQLLRIKSAPLSPTLVYEGRRGYKLLYALKDAPWDNTDSESIRKCKIYAENIQRQLIEFFSGDWSKTNINAAFRLPFAKNYKEFFKNSMVYTEEVIIFEPSRVYTLEQLSEAFPETIKKAPNSETLSYDDYPKEVREIIECFMGRLDLEGLSYTEYEGKLSYQCPIHNDGTASAYMFYNNLICHCSNGGAELDCPIAKGKTLGWVAKEKGWTDLEELCDRLEEKPGKKYEKISLDDMQSTELVPIQKMQAIAKGHVESILADVVNTMNSRGNIVNETMTNVFANIIHELTLQTEGITVCPLEPGGGKSTIMAAYLQYMLDQDLTDSGTIIVVERIETAKNLLRELSQYSIYIDADGKAIDVPHYKSHPATFVMESAYTYKDCKLKLEKYQYGVCRDCPFKKSCQVYKKHQEQKSYPIVIMTHARLRMEADGLDKYRKWRCEDGVEYERKRIIIDEKPPIVEVTTIQNTSFDEFLLDVHGMQLEPETITETNLMVKQLREKIMDAENGQHLLPVNPDFIFAFSKTWYEKYSGENVGLMKDIEYAIQNGGRVNHDRQRNIISIVTNRTIQYNFSDFHVVILDGTSKFDMEYRAFQNHQMLDIPSIKSYENLTLFVDSSKSSSKGALVKSTDMLIDIARNISIVSSKEIVLVLCFQIYEETFKSLLCHEIKEGRVLINHFGNVKGSNEYLHCTALVLAGTIHKSDPFYINKHEAVCGVALDTKTATIKKVRRFKDLGIETIKLNDQVVDTVQDILRICIRNNGNSAQVKVYMLTRDLAFANVIQQYFADCVLESWNMSGTYPWWYVKLDEFFNTLKEGEIIQKATLRKVLELDGVAGKKQFQRFAKDGLFIKLMGEHSIAVINTRTYKKVDRLKIERDQATI
ncbi:hypothetical protein [Sporosarcina ureae]|uniref:hypothetical protein n=1 Tax=Sporosarcina ureae TaxID=1571 RepID=UPI0028A99CA3|nr:hypothetical protein [Sporosarcina ureae]